MVAVVLVVVVTVLAVVPVTFTLGQVLQRSPRISDVHSLFVIQEQTECHHEDDCRCCIESLG